MKLKLKNYQAKLFPYAYNILGSIEDAKDTVQDVLVKHLSADKAHLENEIGYLTKSVINTSINLKKRKSKFNTNILWLPEPLSTVNTDEDIDKEKIITYSLLVLLEKLTAKERAVFILKEAFNYSHKEIAELIMSTVENSRKLLSRAKIKLDATPKHLSLKNVEISESMKAYIESIKNGDVKSLEKMLSEDITLSADGGKDIQVVRELTSGKTATLQLILYVFETHQKTLSIKITEIAHQPALLFYNKETLINCQVFEWNQNKIQNIYSVIDPLKLNHLKK